MREVMKSAVHRYFILQKQIEPNTLKAKTVELLPLLLCAGFMPICFLTVRYRSLHSA